jgi:hypothetical protein
MRDALNSLLGGRAGAVMAFLGRGRFNIESDILRGSKESRP